MSFLLLLFIHINFRIRQIIRTLTLNAKAGFSFFIFIMIMMMVKLPSDYFPILFLFPVVVFHLGRKDTYFLKKVLIFLCVFDIIGIVFGEMSELAEGA